MHISSDEKALDVELEREAPRMWIVGCVSPGHAPITEVPKLRYKAFPDIAQKPKYAQDYVK